MALSNSPLGYRADIDGLRAIAVMAVVLFHAGVAPFRSGFAGVDIFFVISGYLIGGIILRESSAARFSFTLFYARRARRILPALITVVLATCLVGWFVLSPFQFRELGATATSTLLGFSNISFYRYTDYFAIDARRFPLLMTWSLGVEEQFYLCFPILLIAIGRLAPRRRFVIIATITLISLLASVLGTGAHPAAAFYLLPFRAWELGAGVVLALAELERKDVRQTRRSPERLVLQQILSVGGLALVGASICAFNEATPFPGVAAILPVLGTSALIYAQSSWINCKLLSSRPLVFIGIVSYSWYLWHWPLMSYVRNVAFDDPPLLTMILTAAAAFGLAVLSQHFVERPFRYGPIRVRPVLVGYAVVLTVALVFPVAIKTGQGFPMHVSVGARRVESARAEVMSSPCLAGWDDSMPNLSRDCVVHRDERPTVVLIGDSHAGALGPGVRALADSQNWGYEILTKSSCRPLVGVTDWRRAEPQQAETCAAFMKAAFARASSDTSVETVFLAAMWPLADAETFAGIEHFEPIPPYAGPKGMLNLFRYGLKQAVALLTAGGKHVVILGDTPRWRFDVGQVALTKANPVRSLLAPWLWSQAPSAFPDRLGFDFVYPRSEGNARFFESLAGRKLVVYFDLFGRFCFDGSCIFERYGDILFVDTGHLSVSGARFALQGLRLDPRYAFREPRLKEPAVRIKD